jgi:hypothetical protein
MTRTGKPLQRPRPHPAPIAYAKEDGAPIHKPGTDMATHETVAMPGATADNESLSVRQAAARYRQSKASDPSKYATQVQRQDDGKWVGLDGPLHEDDQAALDQMHSHLLNAHLAKLAPVLDEQLAKLKATPLPPRPQTYEDLLAALPAAKDQLRTIRDVEALRGSFEPQEDANV